MWAVLAVAFLVDVCDLFSLADDFSDTLWVSFRVPFCNFYNYFNFFFYYFYLYLIYFSFYFYCFIRYLCYKDNLDNLDFFYFP